MWGNYLQTREIITPHSSRIERSDDATTDCRGRKADNEIFLLFRRRRKLLPEKIIVRKIVSSYCGLLLVETEIFLSPSTAWLSAVIRTSLSTTLEPPRPSTSQLFYLMFVVLFFIFILYFSQISDMFCFSLCFLLIFQDKDKITLLLCSGDFNLPPVPYLDQQ